MGEQIVKKKGRPKTNSDVYREQISIRIESKIMGEIKQKYGTIQRFIDIKVRQEKIGEGDSRRNFKYA